MGKVQKSVFVRVCHFSLLAKRRKEFRSWSITHRCEMNFLFIADSCYSRDHSNLIISCFLNILPVQPYSSYALLDEGLRFIILWDRRHSVRNADVSKDDKIWFVWYLTALPASKHCSVDDGTMVRIMKWEFATETEVLGGIPLCPPQSPHALNWDRTGAVAVGSWPLTAWAVALPNKQFSLNFNMEENWKGFGPWCSVQDYERSSLGFHFAVL
jgi:hypothetical protein